MSSSPTPARALWDRFLDNFHPLRGRHPLFQPVRPLVHAVVYYPLLLPWPLLLYLIAWNRVLGEYDAFHIVWNPHLGYGVLSGAGFAILLGGTLLAVFLLDQADGTPPTPVPPAPPPSAPTATAPTAPGEEPSAPVAPPRVTRAQKRAEAHKRAEMRKAKPQKKPAEPPKTAAPDPAADRGAAATGAGAGPGHLTPPPPIERWAYWTLWLVGLLLLVLPALAPDCFAKRGTPPLFQLNFRDGDDTDKAAQHDRHLLAKVKGLPKYREVTAEDTALDAPGAFAAGKAQMRAARWGFPVGVLATAGLFVASRLARSGMWTDTGRLRTFAGWLLTLFTAHYVLMFLAHLLLGQRGITDRWETEWAVRAAAVAVALAAAGYGLLYLRVIRWGILTFVPVALLVALGFVLANGSGRSYCGFTGAPVPLIGLLGVLIGLAAGVTWLSRRAQWWVSAVAGLLTVPFLFSEFQREYQVPGLTTAGAYHRVPLESYGERREDRYPQGTQKPLVADDAGAIRKTAAALKGGRPLVVVAVSGGATASAVYTADVLFTLEMKYPGFVEQVRVVTGASGGMLGAAYFVSSFRSGTELDTARRRHRDPARPDKLPTAEYQAVVGKAREQALKDLSRDFLGPLVQRWVFQDMPRYFDPSGTTNDRGRALEQGWQLMKGYAPGAAGDAKNADGVLHIPFHALRRDEEEGRVPSLIFTPMMIEDGRQLLVSNLNLDYLVDANIPDNLCGCWRPDDPPTSHTALEFTRLFPDTTRPPAADGEPFRLSTAVRLNASFPFLSPAAALPTSPPRHVVDAGYFDNYGTLAATKWISRNARTVHESLGRPSGGPGKPAPAEIVLLQLHCYEFETETRAWVRNDEDGGQKARPAAMHTVVAPFAGALASRRANMVYRGDERVDAVNMLLEKSGLPRFERFLLPCDENPSLNWVLTPDTLRRIRRSVWERVENMDAPGARDARELSRLIQWGARPPVPPK